MLPRFEDLNDAEREWLASCIGYAGQLVAAYSPADVSRPLDAAALDRTWAAYLATGDTDTDRVNGVINSIGFAFGQLLVDAVGFAWVVATDQYGGTVNSTGRYYSFGVPPGATTESDPNASFTPISSKLCIGFTSATSSGEKRAWMIGARERNNGFCTT